jgi:endonuclease YncB( thermonuclease family)
MQFSVLNWNKNIFQITSNHYIQIPLLTIAFFLFSWVGVMAPCAMGATLIGKVIALSDGDTVTVLDSQKRQYKVRLAGIDTPEKRQAFGNRAKQALASMLFNKQVSVEWYKIDHYDRLIGKIFIDSVDANLEMVRLGLAWHYKAYEDEQSLADRLDYSEAEKKARKDRLGLWQDPSPLPPWEFRHNR